MSDSFEIDSFFGDAASFSDADVHDLSLVLGDPDPLMLRPPPLSSASSLSMLGDDVPLVPLQRGACDVPDDYSHDGLCFVDVRLRMGRSVTMWCVAPPPCCCCYLVRSPPLLI